jgi:hypothetical protein
MSDMNKEFLEQEENLFCTSRSFSYNGGLQENRILELEAKVKEQSILLKETRDSKKSEIEAKNIHIQLLESNLETLKDQLCSFEKDRRELESEKAKIAGMEKELEYFNLIKNKFSDLTDSASKANEMPDEVRGRP